MSVLGDSLASTSALDGAGGALAAVPSSGIGSPRSEALRRAGSADPEAGEPFEELARSAATILGVALAFLAVLDQPLATDGTAGVVRARTSRRLGPRNLAQRSFGRRVLGLGRELLIDDTDLVADPGVRRLAASGNPRAWAGCPVRDAAGRVVGALCVADRAPRCWSARDVEVLRALAAVASVEFALLVALDLSRRHATQRAELAQTLQESLLRFGAQGVAGHGGALGGSCALAAHVPDHNAPTAGQRGEHVVEDRQSRPSEVLAELNRALLDWPRADPRFLTAIYATVAPATSGASVQIAAAGHPLALIHRVDGASTRVRPHRNSARALPRPRAERLAYAAAPR